MAVIEPPEASIAAKVNKVLVAQLEPNYQLLRSAHHASFVAV
jgi:hypothetical protein